MKRSTWLIMIFALFLVVSTAPFGQTSAAEKFIKFEGSDTFDPFGELGTAVGSFSELGIVACPGHEPTVINLPPPVSVCLEGRTNIRGLVIVTRFVADTDLVTGWATITVNANYDADGTGPAWGTISLAPDTGGGTWDGTWQGVRVQEGVHWAILVHASAKGTGGTVEGMLYSAVDRIISYSVPGFPSLLIAYSGQLEGRIINPHSK